MSLVLQPTEEIGKAASELILKRLKGDKSDFPLFKKLNAQLLIKKSIREIKC